jgi:hypothetical protein
MLLSITAMGTPAQAQGRAPAASGGPARWEIEVHAGGMQGTSPAGGDPIASFPVGAGITTPNGQQSRRVSSWFYGDGAALHRETTAALAPGTATIVALDGLLRSHLAQRESGGNIGVRLSRRFARLFSAEISLDRSLTPFRVTSAARSSVEDSRASFAPAFTALLSPLPGVTTTATSSFADGADSTTSVTGAIVIDLLTPRMSAGAARTTGLRPYLVAGGGWVFNGSEEAEATLQGNYRVLFANIAPFDETDSIRVHSSQPDRSLVGVIGGGIKFDVTRRHGLRVDVRAHLSGHATETLVDASPSVAHLSPEFFIWVNRNPSVVFANYAASPIPSSLTGDQVSGLTTFTGTGTFVQLNVTAGYYFRF